MLFIYWDYDILSPKDIGTESADITKKQTTKMKKTKKGKKKAC